MRDRWFAPDHNAAWLTSALHRAAGVIRYSDGGRWTAYHDMRDGSQTSREFWRRCDAKRWVECRDAKARHA